MNSGKYDKTLIFLNFRFGQFYSSDLFSKIKNNRLRLIAILDQQFKHSVDANILSCFDKIYYLESPSKDGFLAEFYIHDLRPIIDNEIKMTKEIRLICTDEFNLLAAGQLRREYGLKGHDDDYLLNFRDKMRMKQRIASAGLRVPRNFHYSPELKFTDLTCLIGLPFVIKPIDSCGSYGVRIIHNQTEYQAFQALDTSSHYQLEEFIQGTLYHVDSLIQDGGIRFICANEYSFPNFDYTRGKPLASIPLSKQDPKSVRLIDFANQCLSALSANNMVNHMELFITDDDEIIFLEISARPPGALLNMTHEINFGINLMDEDLCLQAGLKLDAAAKSSREKVFFAIYPLKPGVIKKFHKPKLNSRVKFTWFAKKGQKISEEECCHIVNKAVQCIVYNSDDTVLRADFECIKSTTILEME